jgi:hypothetical protein
LSVCILLCISALLTGILELVRQAEQEDSERLCTPMSETCRHPDIINKKLALTIAVERARMSTDNLRAVSKVPLVVGAVGVVVSERTFVDFIFFVGGVDIADKNLAAMNGDGDDVVGL